MAFCIGVDVGGTFTDFLVTGLRGRPLVHKELSTPADPSLAVMSGLAAIGLPARRLLPEVERIVHGTTVTTNAVLTGNTARTGLLTTRGYDLNMSHPFAELIDLIVEEQRAGHSRLSLLVGPNHLNPHGVVHGAVVYAMADTGMGAALYPTLAKEQICATIEIKINYFKPIASGRLTCVTELVNRGKSVANLDARVYVEDKLVAVANGNYAIFTPGRTTA